MITEQSASEHCGSSSYLILLAKSEIRTIYLQYEPENRVCQRTHSCETDFASSIIFGEVGLLEYREALTLRGRRNPSGSMEF